MCDGYVLNPQLIERLQLLWYQHRHTQGMQEYFVFLNTITSFFGNVTKTKIFKKKKMKHVSLPSLDNVSNIVIITPEHQNH